MIWRFGVFEYRSNVGLFHAGKAVPLGRQVCQLLEVLLVANGNVVPRSDIAAKIWPKRNISDDSVDRCVYLLRKALRENGSGDLVATAYGRGVWITAKIDALHAELAPQHDAPPSTNGQAHGDVQGADLVGDALEVTVGGISIRVGPEVRMDQLTRVIRAAVSATHVEKSRQT